MILMGRRRAFLYAATFRFSLRIAFENAFSIAAREPLGPLVSLRAGAAVSACWCDGFFGQRLFEKGDDAFFRRRRATVTAVVANFDFRRDPCLF